MTPRPYQIAGRDFLAARRFALLADEMRVGKTPQAILAAELMGCQSILVVCPAIAVPHWRREFGMWWSGETPPGLQIISYDRLRRNWDEEKCRRYDLAIVDECHFAKDPNAKRTKLVYGKGGLGWIAKRVWALSGTPAPKHAAELWPMLFAFGVTDLPYDAFVAQYCTVNYFTQKITGTKTFAIPELRTMLATIMLRRTRKEVAPDMPGIDYQFLEITPTSRADLPEAGDDAWIEANATSMQEERIAVALAKVEPLAEHIIFAIENSLLQQTVVFGWHVEPLEQLAATLNARGIRTEVLNGKTTPKQKEAIQNNFRNGLTKVIAGNIMTCGTAIDLSSASHAFMIELDWVPGNNVQAASRMVSIEKGEGITVDVVTTPGSMDDRVQQVLMRRVRELSLLY